MTVWLRARSVFTVATLAVFASACVTSPKPVEPQSQSWLRDLSYFNAAAYEHGRLPRWTLSAKVGVKTAEAQESASMVWEFADQSNSVRLFGPLGAGAVKIEFDQFGVHLSDNKGFSHRGDSAEELLEQITGWPIPIDALRYWLFSLPQPDLAAEYQLDQQENLSKLKQLGWEISYSGYKDYPNAPKPLARKLHVIKVVDGVQVASVRLIAKTWKW